MGGDPILVLGEPGGALGGDPGLDFQLPSPGGLLMDAQAPGQAVPTAVGQHPDELLPGEHPEQFALALRVSLELLGLGAVGDIVALRVDVRRVEVELLGGVGVAHSALADLGLADDVGDAPGDADVQLPVMGGAGTAPDVIGGADALRHEEVPDGIVSLLAVAGSGTPALAGLGDVLNRKAVVHGALSVELVDLLHDGSPLS